MSGLPARRVSWAAWRVTDEGRVQVVATLVRSDEDEEPRRARRGYATLEEAAQDLGESFRDVVERVLAEGRREGRWRP